MSENQGTSTGQIGCGVQDKIVAFWSYDKHPYLLWGHVIKMRDNGSVETTEYGSGYYFRPRLLLPEAGAQKIIDNLLRLKAAHMREQVDLQERFNKLLWSALGEHADTLLREKMR